MNAAKSHRWRSDSARGRLQPHRRSATESQRTRYVSSCAIDATALARRWFGPSRAESGRVGASRGESLTDRQSAGRRENSRRELRTLPRGQ